jgi:aerobic carbon-monoxide dehydrogenase medium subunit
VIPAPFEYMRASSVGDAIDLLVQHGDDAKLLAGGHSLLPLMKLRLATPSLLVDIGRLEELSFVREAGDFVEIGAMTRHRDLETSELVRSELPVLSHVAGQIGDPQVRHRGSFGGSLAHGDPASDLPAVALAVGATFVTTGPRGESEVPAEEFFRGFLETALSADEVLSFVRVPKGAGPWSFQKFNRRAQDWAIVGAVAVAGEQTRVALVNMGSVPMRATATEQALVDGAGVGEAAERASEGTEPPEDVNASPEFRRHLARVLTRRALEETLS